MLESWDLNLEFSVLECWVLNLESSVFLDLESWVFGSGAFLTAVFV